MIQSGFSYLHIMEEVLVVLKRKILDRLLEWKEKPNRKSLIISGARQIGKTFSVREFGREHYESFVEINFIENPEMKQVFEGALSVDSLILKLSMYIEDKRLIPGKTLILLDEIQECENAIASLKFWNDDDRYDVIATGSALGLSYRGSASYPVGNVEYLNMYSLDFEEFVWANGISEEVIAKLKEYYEKRERVPEAIHNRMSELMKYYMVIGGMPDVVNAFVSTKNIATADEVQRRLYKDYIMDIAHYAKPDIKIKAEKCYRTIQAQLAKENHKFQYGAVEHKATANKFGNSIDWLKNAYFVKEVTNISRIAYPLDTYKDEGNFRLYSTDIGIFMAGYDFNLKRVLLGEKELENKSTDLLIGTAKGGIYEALAADMLIKKDIENIYFLKDPKSTMEIEFIINGRDGILPIEIKAGRKKANSLSGILENEIIPYGIKFSSQNIGVAGKKHTMPLYMMMFL